MKSVFLINCMCQLRVVVNGFKMRLVCSFIDFGSSLLLCICLKRHVAFVTQFTRALLIILLGCVLDARQNATKQKEIEFDIKKTLIQLTGTPLRQTLIFSESGSQTDGHFFYYYRLIFAKCILTQD